MKFCISILSLLPLRLLYFIGDIFTYPLIYYILGYRKKIVRKNLRLSFPDKSDKERKVIEKGYYHHLVDIFAEVVWSYRATEADMLKHFESVNVDKVEHWAKQKGGVIFMLGHLGNWEWTAEVQHRFTQPDMQHYNVYRKLKNTNADKAMTAVREKRSGVGSGIEKNSLLRKLVELKRQDAHFTLGLISDQKPSPRNAHYWTTFLNQDTSFLDGGEMLAKKFDYVVTYVNMTCPKRGHYIARVDLITDDAPNTPDNYITEQFARRLEANIIEQPTQWLWSHNRWKWPRSYRE